MEIAQTLRLAAEHVERHDFGRAEALFRQVLALKPDEPNALYGLGCVAFAAGAYEDAARLIEAAVRRVPRAAAWWFTLGDALRHLRRIEDALKAYEKAARLDPGNALAHNNVGAACQELGRMDEAVRAFRRAVDLAPNDPQYLANLAGALQVMERYEESLPWAEKATEIAPDYVAGWINLGAGRLALGQFAVAEAAFRRALELADLPETRDNLAEALRCLSRYEEAEAVLAPVLASRPTVHTYAIRVKCLKARRAFAEAEQVLREGLQRFPEDETLLGGLGETLGDQGRIPEAIALTDELRQRLGKPDFNAALVAFWLNALEEAPGRGLEEARRAAAACGTPPRRPPRMLPFQGRRLRVGYVSPDLRRHSVAFFFEGLLREHDRSRFEILCYQANEQSDAVTERLRGLADGWRQVARWGDERLARTIREDRIDILVDLAGWTAHNRLPAFARRPAPVQVTYLGYPNTTGLAAMDWRLTDAVADPEGMTEAAYTETLWRLPRVFLAYTPPAQAPEPLDTRPDRPFTFGSFNAIHKISDRLLTLWARVLAAVPDSRLFLKTGALSDEGVRARLLARFNAFGIGADRIELAPWAADAREHLAQYHRVDLALDTYPYHGTTTTCEALWMGVPVLTLAGRTHASRVGASLLSAVGLPGLIAQDDETYVTTAIALAQSPEHLAALRAGLRSRMAASPLCDAPGLARAVEDAYLAMAHAALARR